MSETDPPDTADSSAAPEASRRWTTALILGFLAFQLALPLSYYLGDDRFDERFAWRMFSSIRMTDCQLMARRAAGPNQFEEVEVYRDIQIAWANLIKRNRDEVARAYLERRCNRAESPQVELRTVCRSPDGVRTRHTWRARCERGVIERTDDTLDR
jgi:hypothetical protein